MKKQIFVVVSILLMLVACAEEQKTTTTGKVRFKVISTDSLASITQASAPKAPSQAPVAEPSWVANAYINTQAKTAGKPDEMTITFKNLQLAQTGGANPLDIFTDTVGKDVVITSQKVDISNLFQSTLDSVVTCFDKDEKETGCTNDDGTDNTNVEYAEYEVQTGIYTQLRASLAEEVKIKGCITQQYNGSLITGTHTYCTQTNNSMFNGYGQNSDYEDKVAETTSVSGIGFSEAENVDMSADYVIPGGITISSGEKSDLTLLIDTNRFMRFYNQANGASDGGIPTAVSDKSFFLGTQIDKDMFIFVGKPGKIEGYSYYSRECILDNVTVADIPADRLCDETQSTFSNYIKGWITVVYDANNEPLMVNIKSDYGGGLVLGNNQVLGEEDAYFDKNAFTVDTNNNITSISVDYGVPNPMKLKIESFEVLAVGEGMLTTFTSDNTAAFTSVGWGEIYIKKEF